MKTLRIYVDTSVVGGCFDPEFEQASNALWKLFENGTYTPVLSTHTLNELKGAPPQVASALDRIPAHSLERLEIGREAEDLAGHYIKGKAIPSRAYADALHLALATVHYVDVLVSWNFRDLVNLGTIRNVNAINLALGYKTLEIRSPKEVLLR